MGVRDLGRIDPGAGGKRDQETLVPKHMLQDPGEKAGLARGGADLLARYAGYVEEAAQPFGLFGDESKRLNCQLFRRFR